MTQTTNEARQVISRVIIIETENRIYMEQRPSGDKNHVNAVSRFKWKNPSQTDWGSSI